MANTKTYKIVINGVQESINAVDSLNKQLNDLEQRMNTLNQKGVNVKTQGNSDLDAQEKLEKQILATEEKLAQVRDENYKKLLHMKEELKEYTQIAKSQVASEANQQGLYDTSTMAGMKASLKSIKAEMQMVDIGGDRFQELTRQANELNNKLKEIEQSYGQFGRNVGNYAAGVAEGMSKLKVDVNGVTQEFDTAKQAMKSLRNEMQTLSTKKDLGLISEAEEERLKGLIPVVKQLESSIADAGKPMDALLDSMQSIMAIASVGQGIGAFFGLDDDEIQRSIQKLVALQNVMQGLQVLMNQMQSGEGIGGWLAKGNAAIDKMVTSMFGLTTATKGATVATRAFGAALKAIGIGLIIALIAELIDMYKQWSDEQNKAIEEAEAAQEKLRKSIEETRNAYVSASASYMNAASRLSHLRAEYMNTNNQLKKTAIIKEATAEFKKLGIEVNNVTDAQRILVEKGDKVIEMIRLQGDAAAIAAIRMEAFKKSFNMLIENGYDALSASILAGSNKTVQELDKRQDAIQGQLSKLGKELGVGVKKATKSVSKAAVDGVKELYELQIAAMKEGLNKTLKQLEEERRQKLQKIKKDGVMVAELTKATNALYDQKIEDAKREHAENIKKIADDMYTALLNLRKSNADKSLQLDESYYEKEIDKLRKYQNEIYNLRNTSYGIQGAENLSPNTRESLGVGYLNVSKEELKVLKEIVKLNEEIYNHNGADDALFDLIERVEDLTNDAADKYEDFYEKLRQFQHNYTGSLNDTYERRNEAFKEYWKKRRDIFLTSQNKIVEDEKASENARFELEKDSENKRFNDAFKQVEKKMEMAKDEAMATIENEKELNDALELIDKEYDADWRIIYKEQTTAIEAIEKQHKENLEKIDRDYYEKARTENAEYYAELMQNLRDFQTAIYNLESKTEVKDSWGFINIKKTNENNKKLLESYEKMADAVTKQKIQLNKDYSDGFIDKDVYESTVRELDTFVVDLGEKMDAVKAKMSFNAAFSALASEIDQWTQTIGRSLSQLLTSIWEYQDAQYEYETNQLEKQIDEYDKLLHKQEEITEQHKDAIDDIEDELATSRGDRRQHLIDQLNEEIAAQRRSMIEQKRIEREEEKLKKKKEREEEAQRKREHKRQVQQAFISWHLSIANGLATQPFMPVGLAMGALATALGAVQYALVKSQKYADGGVIQGKSHAQGGVKVLGGRAEVEGGEFITNKRTTAQNLDLLEYINSKRKKVDINDLIEFYNGGKIRKNISNVRTKFADGGVVPSLRTDIDINDRLLTAIESYAERDVVVSVVDINKRQQAVKNVQVLAGLND